MSYMHDMKRQFVRIEILQTINLSGFLVQVGAFAWTYRLQLMYKRYEINVTVTP